MKKKILLSASLAVLGLAMASCSKEVEYRNTVTPYGSLNDKLSTVIATGNDGELSMTLDQYYTRLKSLGYTLVTNQIDYTLYSSEITALKEMYNNASLSNLTEASKNALKIVDTVDGEEISLYGIDQVKYTELRDELIVEINKAVSSEIFSTSSAEQILKKTDKEINTALNAFIDAQARSGINITISDISWISKDEFGYVLDEKSDVLQFSSSTIEKLTNTFETTILNQAKALSAQKALFKIADEEYIYDEEDETETKNSNYLFEDSKIESTYDSSYKTFGTYNAVIIQFNSRREALKAIEKIGQISTTDADAALNTYVSLYNEHYAYRLNSTVSSDDDCFMYTVNEKEDGFEDLSSDVSALITDTLEDGEYLSEPRNINNKYVLAYRVSTTYDYYEDGDSSKQLDYENLTETQKSEIDQMIKENLIKANANSYKNTNNTKLIENADIKIYDPFFEYKYEYANDEYEPIEDKVSANSNVILSVNGNDYTVEEFYEDASKAYATTILTNHFQLEYAYKYYDDYVDQYLINSDNKKNNKDTLESAIKTFKDDKNSTYPKEIGLETYLLASYGYKTKDDVLKYYYNAKEALSAYTSKHIFEEWVNEETVDGKTVYSIADEVSTGFLNNLLVTGNKNYDLLFSINLDHILINIDDNADGTPDDPADFLTKNPTKKEAFEDAVAELANAIYKEAIYEDYKDNTLFETLTYIKTQYEEGGVILSQSTPDNEVTWDSYKDFNFLLTVEQLAASGDITQDSVNNFVVPFKEYVENIYKTASTNDDVEDEYEDGIFYFCYEDNNTLVGSTADDASFEVTFDKLCATNYGYHMIVLNSYEGPESTRYNASDDVSGFQEDLQIVLREYEDENDNEISIYVNTDSYNDKSNEANIKQLFIYYIQKNNSEATSLDADIATIMGSLFDDAITTYTSSNFQNYLLLELIDVEIKDVEIAGHKINDFAVDAQINYYKNSILEYDSESEYTSWFDGTYTWTRPDQK